MISVLNYRNLQKDYIILVYFVAPDDVLRPGNNYFQKNFEARTTVHFSRGLT